MFKSVSAGKLSNETFKNGVSLVLVLFLTGCSSISLDAAKSLSVTGKNVATQTQENIFVSDNEYLRARDSEALMHGVSGTVGLESYNNILALFSNIHQELLTRTVVFEKLSDVYDSFGDLAGLEASKETQAALGNLGGAINEYAKAVNSKPPISSDTTAVISEIGGLIAEEIQKAKIKEASKQIRSNLEEFLQLLETPLVREQMNGFKQFLASDRKTAIITLWNAGLYDPTPLLNDIGADVGLTAQKDASKLLASSPVLTGAMGEIIDKRLTHKSELIERSYDVSLSSIRNLIAEHKKLEEGQELDLARLREIVSRLKGIAALLAKS
ncbi:hypothetical protein [Methylomonas sp. MK1]|uniref:hypothetical protein n=1 Tax=Methylomonas sp. MK1 TaxID=1131552 RepID=UPI00036D91FC|nr:hypothetical protein [Methylomonas sp. MK1]